MRAGLAVAFVVMIAGAVPAAAERVAAVSEALRIGETIEVMHREGIADAAEMARGAFGDAPAGAWARRVQRIYDPQRMETLFADTLRDELDRLDARRVATILAYLTSESGARAVSLEVSARAALLDDDVEQMAQAHLDEMRLQGDPRLDRLRAFARAGDLIDGNVAGGLNATIAFHYGLIAGSGPEIALREDEVVAIALAQEEAIRADTEDWVMSYLALAYAPVAPSEFETRIRFARSAAGRSLNAALFAAFDSLFWTLSYELGHAVGQATSAEEL